MKTIRCITSLGALIGSVLNAQSASVIQFTSRMVSASEDSTAAEIIVHRTNDLETVVSVEFATTNLTATPGVDYLEIATNLTFLAGETNRIVAIPILNDGAKEAVETFRLVLASPGGGALGAVTNATVTIVDNDPGVQFEHALRWIREDEGLLTMKVLRGNDVNLPAFSVDYASSNLTAMAPKTMSRPKARCTTTKAKRSRNSPFPCSGTKPRKWTNSS